MFIPQTHSPDIGSDFVSNFYHFFSSFFVGFQPMGTFQRLLDPVVVFTQGSGLSDERGPLIPLPLLFLAQALPKDVADPDQIIDGDVGMIFPYHQSKRVTEEAGQANRFVILL